MCVKSNKAVVDKWPNAEWKRFDAGSCTSCSWYSFLEDFEECDTAGLLGCFLVSCLDIVCILNFVRQCTLCLCGIATGEKW